MTVPPQPPPVPPGGLPQQPSAPPAGNWQPPAQSPGGWPQQPPAPPGGWPQQPSAPQPGQQPGGWPQPPPPAPPVNKRIPDDLPFVVRPNVGKRALLFGGLLLFVVLVMGCPLGLAVSESGDVLPILGVLGFSVVFFGLLLGLQLWLITSGGPVLAVGPAGLWIKTRPTRGQAIWLPWEGIEQIYRRRWSLEKMVCVKPRDPRTAGNLGAFTALDSGMQQLFFGTGFTATVNFADRSEAEIMQAISHFSAGRCPVR